MSLISLSLDMANFSPNSRRNYLLNTNKSVRVYGKKHGLHTKQAAIFVILTSKQMLVAIDLDHK